MLNLGETMVQLGRQDLDLWLGEPDDFVLAVLRDVFDSDAEVSRWLQMPCLELEGRAPADLLSVGRVREVESAVIQLWNGR